MINRGEIEMGAGDHHGGGGQKMGQKSRVRENACIACSDDMHG
jgi:hypothetical protein